MADTDSFEYLNRPLKDEDSFEYLNRPIESSTDIDRLSAIAGLGTDTRIEGVSSLKQEDVLRLYDVFQDNPKIVQEYIFRLGDNQKTPFTTDIIKKLYGSNALENPTLKNDLKRYARLTQAPTAGGFTFNALDSFSYPPTSEGQSVEELLRIKNSRDELYDVGERQKALSETDIPFYLQKPMALGAGLEKGLKGVGLTITELADVAAGTELTDWLDENWETIDTGGGFNMVLDVLGQFGLGYGASLKLLNGVRKYKLLKRGEPFKSFGVGEKTSKIAGRMGYYSIPALVGDAAVMNLEDKQFGEVFNLYSFGNPDAENLTNREKALERLKRKTAFGVEGAALTTALTALAKPLIKWGGAAVTTKLKDIPGGIGEFIEDGLRARDSLIDPVNRAIAESSVANVPLRILGAGINISAQIAAPVLGGVARKTNALIAKSGLPPVTDWKFFATTGDGIGKAFLKRLDDIGVYLRTAGALPRDVFDAIQLSEGEIRAISRNMEKSFEDMDKEIRTVLEKSFELHGTKSPQQYEHIIDDVVEYLKGAIGGRGAKGKILAELQYKNVGLDLREPARRLYIALRKLRDEAKRIFPKTTKGQAEYEALLDSIKAHFNISFRAFRNPRFKPEPEVKAAAIKEIAKMIKEKRFYNVERQLNPEGTATALVNDILETAGTTKGSAGQIVAAIVGKLADDFPIAKPGEILPDVIQKLLGGPKDARTMLLDVVGSLSQSVWKYNLYDTLYRTGKGRWVFDNPRHLIDNNISNRNLEELTENDFIKAGAGTIFKLGDNALVSNAETGKQIFVTPEMKKALLDDSLYTDGLLNLPIYREFLMLKSSSQMSKTVLSLMTQVRNVTSAVMFPLANGHVGGGASYVDAYRQVARDLFGRSGRVDTKVLDDYGMELERWGVTNSSVVVREMKDMFQKILETEPKGGFKLIDDDAFINFMTKSPIMKNLTDVYQAGDIIHKIYGYEFSKSQYKAAFSNVDEVATFFKEVLKQPFDVKNLNGTIKSLEEAVQEVAGKTVANTYPNYNYIPKLVKELRRAPFGNFISFASEMMRTVGNIGTYAFRELQSSNPYVRQMGAKRLVGLTNVFAIGPVSTAVALKGLGMTEEQMDAIKRNNTAPWNRFAQLVPYSFKPDGPDGPEIKYINLSYSNPYEILQQPLYILMGSATQGKLEAKESERVAFDALTAAFLKLLDPFASDAIIGQAMEEAVTGKTKTGRALWNLDVDGVLGVGNKMFNHIILALLPTTFVNLKRVEQGLIKQDDATNHRGYNKYSKPVDLKEELLALFAGIRLSTVNVYDNMNFTINKFQRSIRENKTYTTSAQYQNLSKDEKLRYFIKAQKANYMAYNELNLAVKDGSVLGSFGEGETKDNSLRKTKNALLKQIEQRLDKKNKRAFKFETFIPMPTIDFKGKAAKKSFEDIEGATILSSFPAYKMRAIYKALQKIPLNLSAEEFDNEIKKALGIYVEEPKTINENSFDYLNRPISSAVPEIPIVQPQTIAAAAPPPINPAINPATGLSATEEALLSPSEKAIRLRNKTRTVV